MNTNLILESLREHIKSIEIEMDTMVARREELQRKKNQIISEMDNVTNSGGDKIETMGKHNQSNSKKDRH